MDMVTSDMETRDMETKGQGNKGHGDKEHTVETRDKVQRIEGQIKKHRERQDR